MIPNSVGSWQKRNQLSFCQVDMENLWFYHCVINAYLHATIIKGQFVAVKRREREIVKARKTGCLLLLTFMLIEICVVEKFYYMVFMHCSSFII